MDTGMERLGEYRAEGRGYAAYISRYRCGTGD